MTGAPPNTDPHTPCITRPARPVQGQQSCFSLFHHRGHSPVVDGAGQWRGRVHQKCVVSLDPLTITTFCRAENCRAHHHRTQGSLVVFHFSFGSNSPRDGRVRRGVGRGRHDRITYTGLLCKRMGWGYGGLLRHPSKVDLITSASIVHLYALLRTETTYPRQL